MTENKLYFIDFSMFLYLETIQDIIPFNYFIKKINIQKKIIYQWVNFILLANLCFVNVLFKSFKISSSIGTSTYICLIDFNVLNLLLPRRLLKPPYDLNIGNLAIDAYFEH